MGVSGLKLSGGLDLRMNRYGDPVDETISTLDGDVPVFFTTGDSLARIAGNFETGNAHCQPLRRLHG
ncbi:MAG UNVERIFIED_CONTAM: hypothetical protein LVR18_02910 [Planctomycetaceae bacterium]